MYYFIINPNSGSGYGFKVWKRIEKLLKLGVEYRAFLTERPGQAAEYADQLTKGCQEPRIIVVVGGDGTVNEVLDGLSFAIQLPWGIFPPVPAMTWQEVQAPRFPAEMLKRYFGRNITNLWITVLSPMEMMVKHRRFAVSAGIGLDDRGLSICFIPE